MAKLTSRDCAEYVRCPTCRERIGDPCNFLGDGQPWYPAHEGPQYHPLRLARAATEFPLLPVRQVRLNELSQMSCLTLLSLVVRQEGNPGFREHSAGRIGSPITREAMMSKLIP